MRCATCGKPAKDIYPLTGAPLCALHLGALQRANVTLGEDIETLIKHLALGYLPEMRSQDVLMLRRIVDQDSDPDERIEMRLHLTARRIAAHIALEERDAVYAA